MSRAQGWARPGRLAVAAALAVVTAVGGASLPAAASDGGRPTPSRAGAGPLWRHVTDHPAARLDGHRAVVRARHLRAFHLDRPAIAALLATAPRERTRAARTAPAELALPAPDGTVARFSLVESPVMAPGLAAAHPEIHTYAGRGIDDPTATVRADVTPLGFHASVRSPHGGWYVDPLYEHSQQVYATYYGRDLTASPHGSFVERDDTTGAGLAAAARALGAQAPAPAAGPEVQLRTYRLALLTDPSYAAYFGSANVTAAKVTLVNRVDQVYEDETAIRLVLIDQTDALNLDTAAKATGANGPCGSAACFSSAQLAFCSAGSLTRTRVVLGQLVGAAAYDVGHLGLGVDGGGLASLGVAGGPFKAQGCTGLPTPVGDFYAVDYVAHEMGHQFGANHTFNGTDGACFGANRNGFTSVEPGSGSSIMAYAGICGTDDLQPHTDPYWSQRSYSEITGYVTSAKPAANEVQTVSLLGFDTDGDSFTLTLDGHTTAPVVRGTSYSKAGIEAALAGIGVTATVAPWGGSGSTVADTGFQVTFNGPGQSGTDVDALVLTDTSGVTGFVGETAKGGPIDNGGSQVTATGNHAPVVTVPGQVTIPVRTPFALTGSATDADGDPLTYLWEQNDRGSTNGTSLVSNTKVDGPLFRQFGTAADVSPSDTLQYHSPGENAVTTDPTRVFPDLAQVLSGNTNAKTGTCPAAPPAPVPAAIVDCYSEFLPTAAYVGVDALNVPLATPALHMRLTVRDGHPNGGGVASADTTLVLAPSAGPFLVTSQASPQVDAGGSRRPVTWDVAGTDVAPVGVSRVRILLSTDGGLTFPRVLAASTPNDGREVVRLPNVATAAARIKVEAVGNVFFDVNDADFAIRAHPEVGDDASPRGLAVQYTDAPTPTVTVSARDLDSAGAALQAVAHGLPAGLRLDVGPASADGDLPGTRTWSVVGRVRAAPGRYPVSVRVTDDTGTVGGTSFDVRVRPEDATVGFTGRRSVVGHGAQVRVRLAALVRDAALRRGSTDRTTGDVRRARVTFMLGHRLLCRDVPVGRFVHHTTASAVAACWSALAPGWHRVRMTVSGSYTGAAVVRVHVRRRG